jgi:hypothetical protein
MSREMPKKKSSLQEEEKLALAFAGRGGTLVFPPLSGAARKRIEAEVMARWPYYKKSKEYRELVREMDNLNHCLASTVNRLVPWPSKNLGHVNANKHSTFAQKMEELYNDVGASLPLPIFWPPEASIIADKVPLVIGKVLEQFGMLTLIPLEATVEDILQIEAWSGAFFPRVFLPAYSDIQESIPTERVAKLRYLLKRASSLPVQLNLLHSKGEILAAVGGIVDAWQARMQEAEISFGRRYREPDCSLFPLYVKAYDLHEQGKSLKQIRDRLFPGEEALAAERKAELYILNGKHLIRGRSDLIGQR